NIESFHINRYCARRLRSIDQHGDTSLPSHASDLSDIQYGACRPGNMGKHYQTCTRRHQLSNSFGGRLCCYRTQVCSTNDDSIAVTNLVQRNKRAGMLMVASDNLVAFMPVEAIANNIATFTSIIGEGYLAWVCVQ